jgi:hypothetical protein
MQAATLSSPGIGTDKYYLNYYASGLNDGNGTLDVRDASGYRQFTITAPGQTPPIRIAAEPQSQAIGRLSPTNLSVSADGSSDPLTYQWRKNGVELTDGGAISGATAANLTISSTADGDAGYYDVLVRKSGAIVTSQTAIISVLAPTAASVSVAGRAWTPADRGLMNAAVTLMDASGSTRRAPTNQFGYFRFDNVQAGQTYIVEVSSKSHSFAPQIVTVLETLTELNLRAQ